MNVYICIFINIHIYIFNVTDYVSSEGYFGEKHGDGIYLNLSTSLGLEGAELNPSCN